MSSEILRMREKTIKKNIENIDTHLNKGEICDINGLKDIIDFANNKITESEKELKLINIELTTNNIQNNFFNPSECSLKLKELKKRLRKLEKNIIIVMIQQKIIQIKMMKQQKVFLINHLKNYHQQQDPQLKWKV